MTLPNTSSFFSNCFEFLTDVFKDAKRILGIWDSCKSISLWVQVLNTFLEHVTIYFCGLPYFYGSLVPFPTRFHYSADNVLKIITNKNGAKFP